MPLRKQGRPKKKMYGGRETPPGSAEKPSKTQANERYAFNLYNDPGKAHVLENARRSKRIYMQDIRSGKRTVVKPRAAKGVTYAPGHVTIDCTLPERKPRRTLKEQVEELVIS